MSESSRSHAFDVFLLTALALVLFVTNSRITFIDDEVSIISAAATPLRQTLDAFRNGSGVHEHPPLYDILLHFWLYLTGGSFVALRIPSIAFYLLGLWLLSRAAEEIAGRPSARALLWLGALWPFGFHFGRLAAWYSFCFLIVAALTLAYLRLLRSPSPGRWMLAMLCAAALVYTNYFGWAILVCFAFDYVWSRCAGRARATWLMIACGFLLALVYVPLWRAFLVELRTGTHFIHSPAATALLGVFTLYSAFVSESVAPWNWALGIPACLCVGIVLLMALRSSPPQARRFLLYALFLMTAMTVLGFISTKRLLPVTAWLLLPVGVTLGVLPRGRERSTLVAALLIILCIGWFGIFSRQYYSAPRFIEPWSKVAAEAAGHARAGALIIGNNPSFFFYLTYALHPPGTAGGWEMLRTFSAPGVMSDGEWTDAPMSLPSEVFLVRGAGGTSDGGPSEEWLNAHCRTTSKEFLLADPAARLKARFLPELGELPWRIQTADYACVAGTRSPLGNRNTGDSH
jgi:hypothetical protein